jgi:trigger factor
LSGGYTVILEVTTKELENRQAVLTAKLEDEWVEPFLRSASSQLANRVAIPGFRRGKAPHRVVVRSLGKEALIREAIDELGRAAYEEAVEKAGLEPIQLDDFDIAEWEPLTLSMTVSLEPTVELGDYRSVPVGLEEVNVEEDDIDEVVRGVQEQYAERVPVDRSAAPGDFALVELEGTLEGRVVLKLHEQEHELRSDADFPVAEFSEKLIGMSVGEERVFSLTFPDDYEDEELAGREVSFRINLLNLQERHLPEIDDDLAKMVGGFATLEELRRKIGEDLHFRREAEQKDQAADQLLDSVAEEAQIDYPPLFLDRELETMLRKLALDLQRESFTLEGYLRATDRTVEDLLDEFRPTAEKRVAKSLVLEKLVDAEGIEVQDTEIEEEVTRITEVYGQDTKELRDTILSSEQVKEDIRTRLYGRKIAEHLSELGDRAEEREIAEAEEPCLAVGETRADPSGASS